MNKRHKRHQLGESVAGLLMLMDGNDRARREIISLEAEVERLKGYEALSEEAAATFKFSKGDAGWRKGWLRRHAALKEKMGGVGI